MTNYVDAFLRGVGVFYIIYLMLYATYLLFSVVTGAWRLYQRDRMQQIRNELKHKYYFPVSILIPAYNEEVTIVDSIRSLLTLDYRLYEIIVIDDGSKDRTAEKLIEAFQMKRVDRPVLRKVYCKNQKNVYEKKYGKIQVTLICKENGGKGDALNMGINASRYPYFLCMDADSLLQRDSLEKIVQPVLEDDKIVAVGGLIRIAQCVTMEKGNVVNYRLPLNPVTCMQVVEYDRSFLASRILMDQFNGNLIISGAFGLFKKDIVIASGGYDTDTLGEDMELAVKLHVFCRNNARPYSIRYEPNAICWSQAPSSIGDLMKQRRRWHLGLFQCMTKYRQIFFNLRFGLVSFISYLYYLLFELLSPFIEIFGIMTMIIAMAFHLLNVPFMLRLFFLYGIYGGTLTITAFFQRIYTQNLKMCVGDILKAIIMCFFENIFFRYIVSFARITAFIGYKKKKKEWGSITRNKQDIVEDKEGRNMGQKDVFKTTMFGGYQKEDVRDYVRSLETEKETVKILINKENSDLKIQLEEAKQRLEEENLLRQKACEQLEEVKENSVWQEQELLAVQERYARQEQELSGLRERFTQLEQQYKEEKQQLKEAKAQRELALERLEEERSQMQGKQNVWADNLRKMQGELSNQQKQWELQQAEREAAAGRLEEELKERREQMSQQQEHLSRLQEETVRQREQISQMQEEAAQRQEKEAQLQALVKREAQEKEGLLENMHKLQKRCEKEMIILQKQYQKESQHLQQQIETLKKSNAGLVERCRRAEAQSKVRVKTESARAGRQEGRKPGIGGMMKRLSPVMNSVKKGVDGMAAHTETPVASQMPQREQQYQPSAEQMPEREGVAKEREVEALMVEPAKGENTAPVSEAPPAQAASSAQMGLSAQTEPKRGEESARKPEFFAERESAEQQYQKRAADVNRSIASAQERIARMLEELQRDVVTEKEQGTNGQTDGILGVGNHGYKERGSNQERLQEQADRGESGGQSGGI